MTKHTPSPWFPSGEDNQIRANTKEGHTTICEMWSGDADARLIASAPEMLIALQAVLDDENASGLSDETLTLIASAVQHAHGRKNSAERLQAVKDNMAKEGFVLHCGGDNQERLRGIIQNTSPLLDATDRACSVILNGGKL